MKAISLHQPWAMAAVLGIKENETRNRLTNVRGRILIHAAAKRSAAQFDLFEKWLRKDSQEFPSIYAAFEEALELDFDRLPFGALIGSVQIAGCERVNGSSVYPRELLFGDYSPERWIWKLRDPVRFARAIPFKGKQGWFEVPYGVAERQNVI
jgi:hypothetical protein